MKKSVKTSEIINAYKVLGAAKYQKLEDSDKIKVWKITRILKPFVIQFEEDKQAALSELISDEVRSNIERAKEYSKLKEEGKTELPMTDEEFLTYKKEELKCNNLILKALQELLDKEVEIDFEPISEDALAKLMASNDWTLSQVDLIEWLVFE